jgi:anti-sigma B factor antagonist
VSLSLQHRGVGEVTVVTCAGRLVAGEEAEAFQAYLDKLTPMNPRIVLHLGGVEFIDSAGLGLLVRYFTRARNAQGALSVCAASPKVSEVLKITRLHAVFEPYGTEADAIADAHGPGRRPDPSFVKPNILCVDGSPDVLAYLREVLKEAGYAALTAGNLPDALILLTATRPAVVVISAQLRAATGIGCAEEFHRLANARSIVELPSDFGGLDAGAAAEHVRTALRAHLPQPAKSAQPPNALTR